MHRLCAFVDWFGKPRVAQAARVAGLCLVVLSVPVNAVALQVTLNTQQRLERVDREQIEGRRAATEVICAFGGAISEAGRGVILASAPPPEVVAKWTPRQRRFERNLVQLGYPPLSERRVAAKIGGAAYVENIARQVEDATGVRGLVIEKGPDAGKLSCEKLREAAAIEKDGG